MTRLHFVKKARIDHTDDIKRGDSYYWWQFAYSPRQKSKTRPKRSQLTRSAFLGQMYDLEDQIAGLDGNNLQQEIDVISSELDSLLSEVEESLDNMPDHLRDTSSSGELLQERIDELESMISEIEQIDPEEENALDEIQAISYNGG